MKFSLAKVLQKAVAGKKYTIDRLLKNEQVLIIRWLCEIYILQNIPWKRKNIPIKKGT